MKNLLLISLLLNFVLAGAAILRSPSQEAPVVPASEISSESQPVENAPSSGQTVTANLREDLAPPPSLDGLRHGEQVAALVEQGWTDEDAKVFALGRVLREQMQWVLSRRVADDGAYWRQPAAFSMDEEFQREMMEMQERMEEVMTDLFGSSFHSLYGIHAELPFPEEKQNALAAMDRDYQMMSHKIHAEAEGFLLPEDHEALALLEQEKEKDLEALLSPEELFEYRLRRSPTAMSLRQQLDVIEPTEEEFRTVFRLQYELDQLQPGQHGNDDAQTQERYLEASKELEEELRGILGEERHRRYERSKDWSYNRLTSLTKRLGLPPERADEVFDVKDYAESEQAALRELSYDDQQTALQALREEVRADLQELLGEQGAELYEEQGGGHWLMMLQ